ncbi:MAG: DUF2631 domain-containing protein [Actinophytocola sp.]|nr:DUF2631 domain-containing protein [Actinophytocola sp.]
MAPTKQIETKSQVDPRDEPSAEWGWHGSFPKATQITGWIIAFVLLAMLIGNHEGNVENLWLVGIAVAIVGALVADIRRRRLSWRR